MLDKIINLSYVFFWEKKLYELNLKKTLLIFFSKFWFFEMIAKKRAEKIVKKSKIEDYLQFSGSYIDIGTGFGHIIENILRNNKDKKIKFKTVDPYLQPAKKVLKRLDRSGLNNRFLFSKDSGINFLREQKDSSVDGISLFYVLHHISYPQQEEIIREIRRVLKNKQFLFLVEDVPEDEQGFHRIEKWDRRLNCETKNDKHYYRTNIEWTDLLKKYDFRIVDQNLFLSKSTKDDEGIITHGSYICKLE